MSIDDTINQLKALNQPEHFGWQRMAFEPFGSMDGLLAGAPIKIMPLGTFYRDQRTLELTPDRLRQIAANFKAGLPRFRVPINENHSGTGKIGTVQDVQYFEQGPDGPGLYATQYDLSEQGKALITQKRFDAVSPEVVWKLNDGATYQDPTTGRQHDNVLVGLALTDRPFFGHDNVALFSAFPQEAMMNPNFPPQNGPHGAPQQPTPNAAETPMTPRDPHFVPPMAGKNTPPAGTQGQPVAPSQTSESGPRPAINGGQPETGVLGAIKQSLSKLLLMLDRPGDQAAAENNDAEPDGDEAPEMYKQFTAEQRQALADEGKAKPDGSYPIENVGDLHRAIASWGRGGATASDKAWIIQRARALNATDQLPADWASSTKQDNAAEFTKENEHMAEQQNTPAVETFAPALSAEEFAALKAKADEFEQQVKAQAAQIETFATDLKKERAQRRYDQLLRHVETFGAMPVKPTELAEKLQKLEEADSDLFQYFDGLLATANKQLQTAGIFEQFASAAGEESADTLDAFTEQVLKEKFSGDRAKYAEAFEYAQKARPDLAMDYAQRTRR